MNTPTWKVLRWENQPPDTSFSIPFTCECGHEADLPCGPMIGFSLIAMTRENWMIFDPPGFEPTENWLPTEVQCRKCGVRLISKGIETDEVEEI